MVMSAETQQFIIRWGFIGVMAATLLSLGALGALAVVHDGALADQMASLFQQVVQEGLAGIFGLVGIHTVVSGVLANTQAKAGTASAPAVAAGPPGGAMTSDQP